MYEHPLVKDTKIGLLLLILVFLVFLFVAHNDTQEKVIETARMVDEVRDQVADVRRLVRSGVPVATGSGTEAARPPEPAGPVHEGWAVLFSPEPDRPRLPDDQIDWDAELRVGSLSEPKGFNLFTTNRDRFVATDLGYYVYSQLGERKDSNKDEFKPGLAKRVEVSPDRLQYHIWLREGVFWHRPPVDLTDPKFAWMKGKHEVTAEDLKFSLDMILDERADTQVVRPSFKEVDGAEVMGKYELRLRWKKPDYYATGVVMGDLVPLPKWIYSRNEDGSPIDEASLGQRFGDHWFNKKMCGYGPYQFREYKLGEYVLLERNEDWWGRRPGLKYIRYRLALRDDEPRYNLFMKRDEKGDRMQDAYPMSATRLRRDIWEAKDETELLRQLRQKELFIFQSLRRMYAFQAWACRGKYFDDKRVRQAMTLCANTSAWAKEILLNQAVFGTGIAAIESPEYDRTVKPWGYDPARAAALLDEAGWRDTDGNGVRDKVIDGQKVEFRFKLLDSPSGSPELNAMRQDWAEALAKIGVIMETEQAEWNLFTKRVEDREFDSYSMAWYHADDFQPDNIFHSRLIKEPGSYNSVEWANARADEIMDLLHTTFDLRVRADLCHELHRIFHEEQPYTILWTWQNSVAWDSRVAGYERPRPFTPQISWLGIYKVKTPPAPYSDGRYEVPKR